MASVEAFDEDQSADGAPGIQYARTCDGVQIAFAATGQGFPLVHMTQIPFNHLRMELEVPEWRRWHRRLGAGRTLVRYDGRGLGLSDRDALDVCTAAMVMDLEAVVQAAGLTSFDLFAGMNVAMAGIAFAAKHPDLVRRMVLWQPYARGSEWTSRSTVAAGFASVEQDWDYACDGAAASAVAWKHEALGRRVAEILKQSSSPPWVLAQRDGYYTEDVSDLLARVHVPTLIAYRPGCRCVSEDAVQRVAQGIPCASVMQLEGDAYLPFAGDVDAVVCAIRSFLDGPDAEADAPVLMNTAN
jgi:pimeloyl-ACP methyl ester carboxylesterase